MGYQGNATSLPSSKKPANGAGKINMCEKAKSSSQWKGIEETFATGRSAGSGNWKGNADSRLKAK